MGRNMILTNQPRLYFTSTLESDGMEGRYKSDIMLFSNLKVSCNKTGDTLYIHCQNARKTYEFKTKDALKWSQKINKVLYTRKIEEEILNDFNN